MKYTITYPLLALTLLASCHSKDVNDQASEILSHARLALRHQNYNAARDSILSMRKKFPTAIEARKTGILLLDTIEIQAAIDSLSRATGAEWERLNVKKQFFERKLQEDKKKNEQ